MSAFDAVRTDTDPALARLAGVAKIGARDGAMSHDDLVSHQPVLTLGAVATWSEIVGPRLSALDWWR